MTLIALIPSKCFNEWANMRLSDIIKSDDASLIPGRNMVNDIIGYYGPETIPSFADSSIFTRSEMMNFLLWYCSEQDISLEELGYPSNRARTPQNLGDYAILLLGWGGEGYLGCSGTKDYYIRCRFDEWCTPKSRAIIRYLADRAAPVVQPQRDMWRRVVHKAILAWELRHSLPLPEEIIPAIMSHIGDKSSFGTWE